MTYNVFGGTLNLTLFLSFRQTTDLQCESKQVGPLSQAIRAAKI